MCHKKTALGVPSPLVPYRPSGDRDGAHVEKPPEQANYGLPTPQPVLPRGGSDAAARPKGAV